MTDFAKKTLIRARDPLLEMIPFLIYLYHCYIIRRPITNAMQFLKESSRNWHNLTREEQRMYAEDGLFN